MLIYVDLPAILNGRIVTNYIYATPN